ncbi:MAG: GFA family protein [Polyangiales bacterium]
MIHAAPIFVHCCRCTWCQRQTGSAFALNALIETSNVTVVEEGTPTRFRLASRRAAGAGRDALREVRVAVFNRYAALGDRLAFVRVGTLDDPSVAPASIHIFTSSKQPWVVLDGSVPVMEGYYRRSEQYSPESYARYAALQES